MYILCKKEYLKTTSTISCKIRIFNSFFERQKYYINRLIVKNLVSKHSVLHDMSYLKKITYLEVEQCQWNKNKFHNQIIYM